MALGLWKGQESYEVVLSDDVSVASKAVTIIDCGVWLAYRK
jgi:hypothetical protein